MSPPENLKRSLAEVGLALEHYDTGPQQSRRLAFLALSKAFEVAVEYAWKAIKKRVEDEGLDPQSPKAAIRDAARVNLVDDPQPWLFFINARNSAAHDYFTMSDGEYIQVIRDFADTAAGLVERL